MKKKPPRRGGALLVTLLLTAGSSQDWGFVTRGAQIAPPQDKRRGIRTFEAKFKTGYEPGEATAAPSGAHAWMVFQNTSRVPNAPAWPMSIFYESPGDLADRYARIIDDPTQPGNHVLHYWLNNAVIPTGFQGHTKGRIQTGFSGQLVGAVKVYSSQRIYLHPDMNHLTTYPAGADPWWISFLLQELWPGAAWTGHTHPSRISLRVYPQGGNLRLHLRAHSGLDTSREYWSRTNPTFALPVGEWFTLEMGYKMGDASHGRMVIRVTPESTGLTEVVFDVTGWTYDPHALDPGGPGPVPLTHWNPQKLYTSDNVTGHIRSQGGVAQIYWDDFSFSDTWPPTWR